MRLRGLETRSPRAGASGAWRFVITDYVAELSSATDEQLVQLVSENPEAAEAVERMLYDRLLIARARVFSLDGFRAFFEYVHGSPLHREGERWAAAIFRAHDTLKKLLQEAFRGSGKTTVISKLFFAFYVGHFPHTTNGVIRVNRAKANETVQEVANLIESDKRYKDVFPHIEPVQDSWGKEGGFTVRRTDITEAEWNDVKRASSRPSGPTFIGYGYDSGSIQGFRVNGILIIDDIHVKENTRSVRQMNDVKSFVKEQLLPIPVPGQGLEIWNFTPWTDNDAYAERKSTGMYIHMLSPVMVETNENDPEGVYWPEKIDWPQNIVESKEKGEITFDLDQSFPFAGKYWRLSWPERWGIVELALKYRDIGQLAFAREYMLDLKAAEGRVLKREYLGFYPHDQIGNSWPVYVGVDYASTSDKLKNKDRDYAAFAILRAIPGGGAVLVDGYFGLFSKPESLKILQRIKDSYPTLQLIKVETLGKGEEFYNDALLIKDSFGSLLPLSALTSHGKASKGDRFENYLAPRFESRRIWVSDAETPFLDEFVNEWLGWPNHRYDDVLDSVYMACVAAEGVTPSRSERSFSRRRSSNPYQLIGRGING